MGGNGERGCTNVGVAVQAHGVGLAHQDAGKGPPVRGVVVVDEKVGDEHHGLDGADRRGAQVRAHTQGLVARRGVELSRLLALSWRGRGHELGAQGQHDKGQGDKGGVGAVPLGAGERPEVLIVDVVGLAVQHGVDRVDALKVAVQEDVGLQLVGKHRDNLGQAALAGPVVGKRVLGADAEHVGGPGRGVGHVGQQAGRGGDGAQCLEAADVEAAVGGVGHGVLGGIVAFLGRPRHAAAVGGAAGRLSARGERGDRLVLGLGRYAAYSRRFATWAYWQSVWRLIPGVGLVVISVWARVRVAYKQDNAVFRGHTAAGTTSAGAQMGSVGLGLRFNLRPNSGDAMEEG